jgi:hypothetical protein
MPRAVNDIRRARRRRKPPTRRRLLAVLGAVGIVAVSAALWAPADAHREPSDSATCRLAGHKMRLTVFYEHTGGGSGSLIVDPARVRIEAPGVNAGRLLWSLVYETADGRPLWSSAESPVDLGIDVWGEQPVSAGPRFRASFDLAGAPVPGCTAVAVLDPRPVTASPSPEPTTSDSPAVPNSPTQSSGPSATPTPSSPAHTLSPTSTTSSPSQTPTATTTPMTGCITLPSACGYPDATNTGLRPGTALVSKTGNVSIRADGTVIDGWDLEGSLDIYADNVTVRNSRITTRNWWGINQRAGVSGLRVEDVDIVGVPGEGIDGGGTDWAVSNAGGSLTVLRTDMSLTGDGVNTDTGLVADNYVHDLAEFTAADGKWWHNDGIQAGAGSAAGLTVRHNTVLNPAPPDRGGDGAIALFQDWGDMFNVVVDDNLVAGGGYVLRGGGPGTRNLKFTNNVVSRQYYLAGGYWGPAAAFDKSGSGNVWSGNRFEDGKPIPAP